MPTRNRAAQLAKALDAIKRIEFSGTWEVIVVDNGSRDETQAVVEEAAKAISAPVKCIYVGEPGAGRARNAGCLESHGRIIAATDDDCYPAANFLSAVVRAFEDQSLGFVTGRVELFDPTDAPLTINTSREPRRYAPGRYINPDGIIGGNLSFRREALAAVGGYDQRLGPGTPLVGDDVDAVARVSHAGWAGAYDPAVLIWHHHGRKPAEAKARMGDYHIARGAYHVAYLLRGQWLNFARAVASLRWRMGPIWRWGPASLAIPFQEAYGAAIFVWLVLIQRE
jgi:hypothetical protein